MDSRIGFLTLFLIGAAAADGGCGRHTSLPLAFPWQAYVYRGNDVICAASLIHHSTLLTQGLCGRSIQESPAGVVVVIGNQHRDLKLVPKEYRRKVAVVIRPGQSEEEADTEDIDLALLILDHPTEMEPVCLPRPNKRPDIPDAKAYVLTWNDGTKASHTLRTMGLQECLTSAEPRLHRYISDGVICLDNGAGEFNLPLGSAGCGAYYKAGPWTLGGVLTLGGPPAVFTRLTPEAVGWARSALLHRPKRSLSPDLKHEIDL